MDIQTYIHGVGRRARAAARVIARADAAAKNRALAGMAAAIERDATRLLEANARDLAEARRLKLDSAMIDRLTLDPNGIAAMADGLRQIAAEAGMAVATLATAWTLAQDFVGSTIIGATKPEQLDETLAAADRKLSEDLLNACKQVGREILYPMG